MSKPLNKKVRTDRVYGTVNVGDDGILSLTHDLENDTVQMTNAVPGSTRTERFYDRESGKLKVLASIPSDGSSCFDATKAVLAYDWVIAIDTNTHNINGVAYSVCVSYYIPQPPVSYRNGQIPFIALRAYLISGVKAGVSPERIGWHLVLTNHIRARSLRNQRLAVVVDSELGLHAAINSRETGYYGDHLLPSNTSLVYASDSDRDTLPGAMIQLCHKTANMIFETSTKRGSVPLITRNSLNPNFQAYALIRSAKT